MCSVERRGAAPGAERGVATEADAHGASLAGVDRARLGAVGDVGLQVVDHDRHAGGQLESDEHQRDHGHRQAGDRQPEVAVETLDSRGTGVVGGGGHCDHLDH